MSFWPKPERERERARRITSMSTCLQGKVEEKTEETEEIDEEELSSNI